MLELLQEKVKILVTYMQAPRLRVESVGPSVPERRQSIVYVHGAFARRVAGRGALGGACGAWRGVCCGAVCPLCWLQPQPAASVFVLLNLCGWPHFGTGFFLSFLTSSGTTAEKFSRRVALGVMWVRGCVFV